MLFETFWFYTKNYQSNKKKFTEHKDSYFVLSLTHFGSRFIGSVGVSMFWVTYNQVIIFSMILQDCEGHPILGKHWLKLG